MKTKLAIVCAWREGETDLQATIDSAAESAGPGAAVYAVEDKDRQGPARTRHRGIVAADGADIICIIDAHMRFDCDVLRAMARHVRAHGGLSTALCHHNADCDLTGSSYAGARIVYRAKDGKSQTALCGKWSKDTKPGKRGCVMGACYTFRRDWYFQIGQPLAALPGWGCDEEALSIACWLSGETPRVHNGHVAHRYRPAAPWQRTPQDSSGVYASRMALIHGVVTDASDRRELEQWTREPVREGVPACTSAEGERFRQAMLKQPRKWREWRAQVCEPDELDGVQSYREPVAVDRPAARLAPRMNPVSILQGVDCKHCRTIHDPLKLQVLNTYANSRRFRCPVCGNPFIAMNGRLVATP